MILSLQLLSSMVELDLTRIGLRMRIDAGVFEQASCRSSVHLRLIVQELQVVRALIPFVNLAIRTRAQLIRCVNTLLLVTKSGRSTPVRIFWRELLRLEALNSLQLCLV